MNNSLAATEHAHSRLSWEQTAPWFRRSSAKLGLQGKLTIGFMFLMSVALGGSCWFFMSESRAAMERVVQKQATAISHTLAMASETFIKDGDTLELRRLGSDLLKNESVVAIAFYDSSGRLLSVASEDPDLAWLALEATAQAGARKRMRVRKHQTPALGRYLEVTAPVTSMRARWDDQPERVVGYVRLCFSQANDEAHLTRATQMLILIGASVSLICFPLVYGLVHRIFLPIRELVDATERIAGGNLDTQVAIHRPDVIGTLARSFNEMIIRVREQQVQLQGANLMLADANDDLEKKVEQRTGQLEAANQRLKSEIAEKEDFLRAVSHDLNAPLRNISGMATMLLMKYRERFDDDIIHRLQRIQKNVEVEADLITELLELSRIKTRRQKTEPVNVAAVIEELSGMFENDLRTRNIRLLIDNKLPVLLCERARMRQVFQNLIDNAIKYMGDRPAGVESESGVGVNGLEPRESSSMTPGSRAVSAVKAIHIGCVARADEAEFYVRDTGIGIEPDDLDKVFYVFRRGRSAAVQSVAGKGVGLASVKSIIETYSGTIWVESRIGEGSTFRFTINGKFLMDPSQGRGEAA